MCAARRNAFDCICLVGPTGTGKSRLAVEVAERIHGEIINCDSRQVYRDFPIITAQPGRDLTRRCRHWLYGFLETEEPCSAGFFSEQALVRIQDVISRGRWPILVGGTGLYLRSILQGLAPIPDIPPEVRSGVLEECRDLGPEVLHREVSEVDPDSAAAIHPRDAQRLTRALEVFRATGRPLSWWHKQGNPDRPRLDALKLGLRADLQILASKLEQRIEDMLARGALEEAAQAWSRCPDESAPGWSGIGCYELLNHLLGRTPLAEAKREWLRKTRAYAKRQITWFKKEEGLVWFNGSETDRLPDVVISRISKAGGPKPSIEI